MERECVLSKSPIAKYPITHFPILHALLRTFDWVLILALLIATFDNKQIFKNAKNKIKTLFLLKRKLEKTFFFMIQLAKVQEIHFFFVDGPLEKLVIRTPCNQSFCV